MASTLDYLRWRGDLPFQACPFNSLDASLMASLAYLPFDGSTVGHSLGEVCQSIYNVSLTAGKIWTKLNSCSCPSLPVWLT